MSRDPLALARHYLEINRPERALDVLGESAADDEAAEVVAAALIALERPEGARERVRDALARDGDSPELLRLLALAEAELGDYQAAERALLAGLELEPDDPALLLEYGHLLARAAEPEAAEHIAQRLEEAWGTDELAADVRIAAEYVGGRSRAAVAAAKSALAHDPEDENAHAFVGFAALERGDPKRAARHLGEVMRRRPDAEQLVGAARMARAESHWLLAPLRPIRRFGELKFWLVYAGVAILVSNLVALAGRIAGVERDIGFPVFMTFFVFGFALRFYAGWIAPALRRAIGG
jgi:cytochrome c-type biogenesis protein CcmH/NrfG